MILTKRQINNAVFEVVVVGGVLLFASARIGRQRNAVRLLGCAVYLRGIASEIATTLVQPWLCVIIRQISLVGRRAR